MVTALILPPSYILFLGTFGLIIHLFLASLVYRTSSEYGLSPIGWTLFYFFTGPIGWIAFMLAREMSTVGGSSVASPREGTVGRERVIDQRALNVRPPGRSGFLTPPSEDFHDIHLSELISSRDWEAARGHADEMLSLAKEDGNAALAGDYRQALLWIEMKRNPFRSLSGE